LSLTNYVRDSPKNQAAGGFKLLAALTYAGIFVTGCDFFFWGGGGIKPEARRKFYKDFSFKAGYRQALGSYVPVLSGFPESG
jgi:hypothetical protein